jgi:hypothetical protein
MQLCYYICEVIVLRYNDDECKLYKKMYLRLFNAVTDALEETDVNIKDSILRKAQQVCEEIYINNDND